MCGTIAGCKVTHFFPLNTSYIQLLPLISFSIPKNLCTFAAQNAKTNEMKVVFKIQQYGRTELAQIYFPDINPDSAWKKLKHWIDINHDLTETLHTLGYTGCCRSFTPAQVEAIVHFLGEP